MRDFRGRPIVASRSGVQVSCHEGGGGHMSGLEGAEEDVGAGTGEHDHTRRANGLRQTMRLFGARAGNGLETASSPHPCHVGSGGGCERNAVERKNLEDDWRMILIVLHGEVVGTAGGAIEHSPHLAVLVIYMKSGEDFAVDGEEPFAAGVVRAGIG